MQRTYWIKYDSLGITYFDKITYRSPEERPRFHKVEALDAWKQNHRGYGWMRINHIFTKEEMKSNGYDVEDVRAYSKMWRN